MRVALFLTMVCGLGAVEAEHQNNAFLPGDAFFSTSLTQKESSEIEEDQSDSILLQYQRLDNRFIPGGHLGYSGLRLTGVDDAFRSNFLAGYQDVREWTDTTFIKVNSADKEELLEWNPVVALVYNKDKVAFPLGVKFNENWKKEGEGEYCAFVDDGWSILQDWKRGDKVPPLKLSRDLDPKEHHVKNRGVVPKLIGEPLLLDTSNSEVVFVGVAKQDNLGIQCECPNLKILARFANWRDLSAKPAYCFYVRVTSERVTRVSYERGKREDFVLNEEGQWVELKKE